MSCGGCGGIAPCSCNLVEGPGINIVRNGNTYTISGEPSPLPAPGCGLQLVGGTYAADTLPFSSLTREQCGDRDDNDGPEIPLAAGCELQGQAVYCDSAGNLRTAPQKYTDVRGATSNEGFSPGILVVNQTPQVIGNTISMPITNPSSCYCLCGYLTYSFIEAMSATGGSFSFLYHEVDFGDGVFAPTTAFTWDKRNVPGMEGRNDRPSVSLPLCLDPGETKTIRYRVVARRFTGDAGGTVNITALAKDLRFVGSNV